MGSAIQPDQRNSEFFRHVATKRRSSSAMLDQTLLGKESPGQFFACRIAIGGKWMWLRVRWWIWDDDDDDDDDGFLVRFWCYFHTMAFISIWGTFQY